MRPATPRPSSSRISTAANRAVNIPEFVNASYDEALLGIDVPGVRHRLNMERGDALLEEGRLPEALTFFQRAVDVNPEHGGARLSLGYALSLMGGGTLTRPGSSRRRSGSTTSWWTRTRSWATPSSSWSASTSRSVTPSSTSKRNPTTPRPCSNLAYAYIRKGRLDEALGLLAGFLIDSPNDIEVHKNMALIQFGRGRPAEAVEHLKRVVHWEPGDLQVTNALARQLATRPDPAVRDGERAVRLATRLAKASERRDAGFLDTLAAAYAEAGRLDEAVAAAEEALRLAPPGGLRAEIEARLAGYRAGKPFRYRGGS